MEELNIESLKLSIITINLNNKLGLQSTILSVINQCYSNFELIVIDGGSIDGSLDVINNYAGKISYWCCEQDNGIYHAMNKGIKRAKGEYCFFLNSGDFFVDSQVLEKIFEYNPEEDIVFGNLIVTIKDKVIGNAKGKNILSFSDLYNNTIKHQSSFIKRSILLQYGLFNEKRRIVADWEFFILSLGLGNASYRYIDLSIAYFDNNGLSNNNPEIVKTERELVIKENIPRLMRPDFDFLYKYKEYERIYSNKISFLFVRFLNKFF